jgi:DNA-binding response OmpR family regulator
MPVVFVYSDDQIILDDVRLALGRSPAPGVDNITYLFSSDGDEVIRAADQRQGDLFILDGEAWPVGGLGLARQMRNELAWCPPIIALIGRVDDAWLGTWSLADAVLMHPVDAVELTNAAVRLLTQPVGAKS